MAWLAHHAPRLWVFCEQARDKRPKVFMRAQLAAAFDVINIHLVTLKRAGTRAATPREPLIAGTVERDFSSGKRKGTRFPSAQRELPKH
jgi:hypothetical protein